MRVACLAIVGPLAVFIVGAFAASPGASDVPAGTRQTPALPQQPQTALQAVSCLADVEIPCSRTAGLYRQRGAKGLAELIELHDRQRERLVATTTDEDREREADRLERLARLVDNVGAQRDCAASRLYWHTDLASAMATAREEGKPILSLRMLGKLTDEFSCANSRFFRAVLYPNADVSTLLREQFVLHWETFLPVPRITIDFGDGRKLHRTVTGNSAHVVLTADGVPVDVIPGMYGPTSFLARISAAAEVARQVREAPEERRDAVLHDYHQRELAALDARWNEDVASVPAEVARPDFPLSPEQAAENDHLPFWQLLAAHEATRVEFDEASRRVIASQNPTAFAAGRLAVTKSVVESPLVRLLRNLRDNVALDTVRNEYVLHRRVHEWFASAPAMPVAPLTDRVYAELFLMPRQDPWLGLVAPDAYTGLQDAGVELPAK